MPLDRFGFTPTETRVYETLLRLGPSTGYAVSKAAGLARANAYQALDAIVRRGAARRAATIPSRYAAIQPDVLVTELERGFRRDLTALQNHLRRLPAATPEQADPVSSLDAWGTFAEAVVRSLAHAGQEVLAIGGPWAPDVGEALIAAQQRGVVVRALWLGHPAPPGALIRTVSAEQLEAYWSGLPVAVVVDRARALCGILREGGEGGGIETAQGTVVPFLRHLLRREIAAGGASPA